MQCCGLTRARNRCTHRANTMITIYKADFEVCKKHNNKRLLSKWEKELYRRILTYDNTHNPAPTCIQNWLECFHEGWENTQNIFVSSNYATSLYKQDIAKTINFNRKFKIYVDTILDNTPVRDTCGICMEDITISSTECDHKFCKGCMTEWLKRSTSCPQCRRIL